MAKTYGDLAERVQTWWWYWALRVLSGLTDPQLDERYRPEVPPPERGSRGWSPPPETFYRYAWLGVSPERTDGHRKGGRSMLWVVHERGSQGDGLLFLEARDIYRADLWALLLLPDPTLANCRTIADRLVDELHLARVSLREREWIEQVILDSDLCARLGVRSESDALSSWRASNDFQLLSLLCAEYRLAWAGHAVALAAELQDAVRRCLLRIHNRWEPPKFLYQLLCALIDDRIFGERWLKEADFLASLDAPTHAPGWISETRRKQKLVAYGRWYLKQPRYPIDWPPLLAGPVRPLWSRPELTAALAQRLTALDAAAEEDASYLALRARGAAARLRRGAIRRVRRALGEVNGNDFWTRAAPRRAPIDELVRVLGRLNEADPDLSGPGG